MRCSQAFAFRQGRIYSSLEVLRNVNKVLGRMVETGNGGELVSQLVLLIAKDLFV